MIDTAAKRKSCIGLALLPLRMGLIPDGSNLAAAERLHVNMLYSGIAAATPTPPSVSAIWTAASLVSATWAAGATAIVSSWSTMTARTATWTAHPSTTAQTWTAVSAISGAWTPLATAT